MRVFEPWVYFTAAGINTLCRLGWAVYISDSSMVVAQHLTLVLGAVELYRRAQWALLRLEWEQIKRAAEAADARLSHAGLTTSLLNAEAGQASPKEEAAYRGSRRQLEEEMVAQQIEANRRRMEKTYSLAIGLPVGHVPSA